MRRLVALALTLVAGAFAVAGCSEVPVATPEALASREVRIATTTNFITDLARRIGGDRVRVTGLMGPGVDPHMYKASAGDVKTLAEADVVLYGGLELEGKMSDVFERLAEHRPTLSVTRDIPRSELLASPQHPDKPDPHVWFDVTIWERAARTTAAALADLDPGHADEYRDNLREYLGELRELDAYAKRRLGEIPARSRVLVTSHDAFRYLGRRYGLEVVAIQGISTATEATTADVERVAAVIADRGVRSVFVESSVPRADDRRGAGLGRRPRHAGGRRRGAVLRRGRRGGDARGHLHRDGPPQRRRDRGGPAMSALEVRRLTVSYSAKPVLWDVDATFPEGALSAIVGPNGAGKSTLLRAALGLVPADAGQALILGRPARKALDQVAYVPQREAVDWDFPITVREVVEMGRYRSRRLDPAARAPGPQRGRGRARAGRHGRVRQAPDRRAVRRPAPARVPRPRARAGGARAGDGRAVRGRRRPHRVGAARAAGRAARRGPLGRASCTTTSARSGARSTGRSCSTCRRSRAGRSTR